jgi:hypothetical protein
VLLALAAGCRPSAPAQPAPPPPPLATPHAHLPLPERLVAEARTRPAARLRPEAVRQALEAAGITLPHWRQVLGSTVGARYCMAGQTSAGLAVALCEFDDPASADRGLEYSRATFDRLIPGRQLRRKENSLLTVAAPPGAGRAIAGQAERVTEIFAAL